MSETEEISNAVATENEEMPKNDKNLSKTGRLVMDAIKNLNDKHGSSYIKIKNYIVANNEIDFNRFKPLIKKFIASALTKGIIVNTSKKTGTQYGQFKIANVEKSKKKKVTKVPKEASIDGEEAVPAKKKKIAKSKNVASPQVKKPKSKSIKVAATVGGKKKNKPMPQIEVTDTEEQQPSTSKDAEKATKKGVKEQGGKIPKNVEKNLEASSSKASKKTEKPKKKVEDKQKETAKSNKKAPNEKKPVENPKKEGAKSDAPKKKLQKKTSSQDGEN